MATSVQMITPSEVAQIVPKVVAQAQQIEISTADDYEMAASFLTALGNRKKEVEATFDPIIGKAHDAHKEALAQKKKFFDPLVEAERAVKSKMVTYSDEQARQDRERQRIAEEQARQEQQEAAAKEAADLEARGETHLADIVRQAAAEAPAAPVVVPSTVPKTDGVATVKVWKWEITDEALIPREFLAVNPVAVNAVVKAQKGMARIPGVKIWSENDVRRTGR